MTRSDHPSRWMDTPLAYGWITRALHWGIAALMLWQFFGMGLRLIFGRQPFVGFFVGTHQPVGIALFVLILIRLVWAIVNRRNRPSHGGGIVGFAARAGHLALYGLMLVVPLLAILRKLSGTGGPPTEGPVAWPVALGNALHGELAWVMAVLILGHVAMVIVHERLWRDGTLSRMAGRATSRG